MSSSHGTVPRAGRLGATADTEHDGMVPREVWAQTSVGRSSSYSCRWCGEKFTDPQDFYDHYDAEHQGQEVDTSTVGRGEGEYDPSLLNGGGAAEGEFLRCSTCRLDYAQELMHTMNECRHCAAERLNQR